MKIKKICILLAICSLTMLGCNSPSPEVEETTTISGTTTVEHVPTEAEKNISELPSEEEQEPEIVTELPEEIGLEDSVLMGEDPYGYMYLPSTFKIKETRNNIMTFTNEEENLIIKSGVYDEGTKEEIVKALGPDLKYETSTKDTATVHTTQYKASKDKMNYSIYVFEAGGKMHGVAFESKTIVKNSDKVEEQAIGTFRVE